MAILVLYWIIIAPLFFTYSYYSQCFWTYLLKLSATHMVTYNNSFYFTTISFVKPDFLFFSFPQLVKICVAVVSVVCGNLIDTTIQNAVRFFWLVICDRFTTWLLTCDRFTNVLAIPMIPDQQAHHPLPFCPRRRRDTGFAALANCMKSGRNNCHWTSIGSSAYWMTRISLYAFSGALPARETPHNLS